MTDIAFTPEPPNDFREFIGLYYRECRLRVPRITAIAGKWRFEDLIPGLSDFDTCFIVEDEMSVDDWCAMSEAVGQVHLDLCARYPHWARNLEHLPGINLTWRELTDPVRYYPEYPQWSFYETTDPDRLQQSESYLAARRWNEEDEYFHLKKFCLYYGRYDRTIDPSVNLGPFESKYPLHSRFMHYFCPPLQAAMSLLERRPICGKLECLHLACARFPEIGVLAEMQQAIDCHYELPALYREPELTLLEDRLEDALLTLKQHVAEAVTLIPDAGGKSIAEWKADLRAVPVDPLVLIFDAARFSRLMKGRLRFYAHAPAHFDAGWLIENELKRIRYNFLQVPFTIFWELLTGERVADVMVMLPRLATDLLTREEVGSVQVFNRLTSGPRDPASLKPLALVIATVFDGFYHALDKVVVSAGTLWEERCRCVS